MAGINCIDYSTLTVSNTAVTLSTASPGIPSRARGAYITCETDNVRWRADGTDPTSTEGHIIYATSGIVFDSSDDTNWRSVLLAIKFIRVTNDAALKITWYD